MKEGLPRYKAVNILWDVDEEDFDEEDFDEKDGLPTSILLPPNMVDKNGDYDADQVGDFLSEQTGFCHFGFDVVRVRVE